MTLGRVACRYSAYSVFSTTVLALHKSGFLQWCETIFIFTEVWVSFFVTLLTNKVKKYSCSENDASGLTSLRFSLRCFWPSPFALFVRLWWAANVSLMVLFSGIAPILNLSRGKISFRLSVAQHPKKRLGVHSGRSCYLLFTSAISWALSNVRVGSCRRTWFS